MVSQTFDAYVPSNLMDFLSQAKFQPTYVPFSTLHNTFLELDAEHNATNTYTHAVCKPGLLAHCIRSCYFALALLHTAFPAHTPGIAQVDAAELRKRVYLACMLHDVGLTESTHPAHTMSFELGGGIMAYEHLRTEYPGLPTATLGDVVQGIMLHTISFERGMSSAAGMLLQMGALLDILGFDATGPGSLSTVWNREMVREIEEFYPRGDMGDEVREVLDRELRGKPDCVAGHSLLDFERVAVLKNIVE